LLHQALFYASLEAPLIVPEPELARVALCPDSSSLLQSKPAQHSKPACSLKPDPDSNYWYLLQGNSGSVKAAAGLIQ
jgi:hypothetical protein